MFSKNNKIMKKTNDINSSINMFGRGTTINGDIVTNKLSIEPGASFSGSCSMGAVIKDIKHAEKQDKKEKTA